MTAGQSCVYQLQFSKACFYHPVSFIIIFIVISQVGEEKGVNLKCHVNELDGDRLVVQTKEEVKGRLC